MASSRDAEWLHHVALDSGASRIAVDGALMTRNATAILGNRRASVVVRQERRWRVPRRDNRVGARRGPSGRGGDRWLRGTARRKSPEVLEEADATSRAVPYLDHTKEERANGRLPDRCHGPPKARPRAH